MAKVIVQVATERDDVFREIEEDDLRKVASWLKDAPPNIMPAEDLATMRKRFWDASKPTAVQSSSEADYELVLDGVGDEESWHELIEAMS